MTTTELLDDALGDAWLWHQRESWVWIRNRFVPYPFQNNIHRLDAADRERVLDGLVHARARQDRRPGLPTSRTGLTRASVPA